MLRYMESTFCAPPSDLIAMNITIAALEQWLKNVSPDRTGEELGHEVGQLYRKIHLMVDEMSPIDDDDDDDDDDVEDDEDEDEGKTHHHEHEHND